MYELIEALEYTQIINKSTFITNLIPVCSVDEATLEISKIRKKYYDATHNCYSFIVGKDNITARSSDDGEPSKTAGIPIYEVLNKNEVTNILCVVTRYFGGIKLGAGGLIRAYSSSCALALKEAKLKKIEKRTKMTFEFDYTFINEMNKILQDEIEVEKRFETKVIYIYDILDSNIDQLKKDIINLTYDRCIIKSTS